MTPNTERPDTNTTRTAAGIGRLLGCLALSSLVALGGCSGSSSGSDHPPGGGSGPIVREPPPSAGNGDGGAPRVELTASDSAVAAGEVVELSWTSANADQCTASGGWSGDRGTQGRATGGPITEGTTFTLTCSGAGGNAMAMVTVAMSGVITLKWQPPAENVDGTPVSDLAGYRIYYGERSREYTNHEAVPNPRAMSHDVPVVSGSYYFAMTVLDSSGNESGYSNEVVKVLN
jgi:hypothetical protein